MAQQGPPPEGGAAGAETTPVSLTGGSGKGKASKKVKKPAGSTLVITPGARTEKGYPLTRDELWLLGSLGTGTTASFALASGMVGYYVNVGMNLALAQGVPEKIVAYYESTRQWSLLSAIALYVIGMLLTAAGGLKVVSIIRRTTHDEE